MELKKVPKLADRFMTMGSIRWIALGCRWFFLIETQEVRVVVRGRRVIKRYGYSLFKKRLAPALELHDACRGGSSDQLFN